MQIYTDKDGVNSYTMVCSTCTGDNLLAKARRLKLVDYLLYEWTNHGITITAVTQNHKYRLCVVFTSKVEPLDFISNVISSNQIGKYSRCRFDVMTPSPEVIKLNFFHAQLN